MKMEIRTHNLQSHYKRLVDSSYKLLELLPLTGFINELEGKEKNFKPLTSILSVRCICIQTCAFISYKKGKLCTLSLVL